MKNDFQESCNLNLLIVVLYGYLLLAFLSLFSKTLGFEISAPLTSFIYFSITSIFYGKKYFVSLIGISFVFLIAFLSFKNCENFSLSCIYSQLTNNALPMNLFSFLLVPFVFMGLNADFFALPNQTRGVIKNIIAVFFIPVLLKRELLKERFYKINECLYSRGIECEKLWARLSKIHLWSIPLVITALLEGAECSEYNEMLHVDIMCYKSTRKSYYISGKQKCYMFFLIMFLGFRGVLWINS